MVTRVVRRAGAGALATMLAVVLAACGGGPPPPVLDGVSGAVEDEAPPSELLETFDGTVTRQDPGYGDPVPAAPGSDRMVVPALVLLSVQRTDGGGTVEIEVVRDYVSEDATASPAEPLSLPDEPLRFSVVPRADGVYECSITPCISVIE